MHYWLLKSEPESYSIDDLRRDKKTRWDGIRNYQARNFLRDEIKKGDLAFFYHSSTGEVGIVGLAKIVKAAYPDPTQFDAKSDYYDPKAKSENPPWVSVDVTFVRKFKKLVPLHMLKNDPFFKDMPLTRKGMRLSVQPVGEKHFEKIIQLASN